MGGGNVIMPISPEEVRKRAAELRYEMLGSYPRGYKKPTDREGALGREAAGTLSPADSTFLGLKARATAPRAVKPYDPAQAVKDSTAAITLRMLSGKPSIGDPEKLKFLSGIGKTPEKPETTQERVARMDAEATERMLTKRGTPADTLRFKGRAGIAELKKPLEKPKEYTRTNYNRDLSRLTSLSTRRRNVEALRGGEIEDETMQRIMSMYQIESISPEILDAELAAIDRERAALEPAVKQYAIKERFKKIPKEELIEGAVVRDNTVSPPVLYKYRNGDWIEYKAPQGTQ